MQWTSALDASDAHIHSLWVGTCVCSAHDSSVITLNDNLGVRAAGLIVAWWYAISGGND